jgi:hypothetical protein
MIFDDDGVAAFEALPARFFALGQLDDALGPKGCGEAEDG